MTLNELKKSDVGRWVVYNPGYGESERGRIKSWNDKFVFVVFKCADDWDDYQNYTGCSVNCTDLEFV